MFSLCFVFFRDCCSETCKSRRRDMENEAKTIRRELHVREDQIRQLERETLVSERSILWTLPILTSFSAYNVGTLFHIVSLKYCIYFSNCTLLSWVCQALYGTFFCALQELFWGIQHWLLEKLFISNCLIDNVRYHWKLGVSKPWEFLWITYCLKLLVVNKMIYQTYSW